MDRKKLVLTDFMPFVPYARTKNLTDKSYHVTFGIRQI
jgi:hypothetical protein